MKDVNTRTVWIDNARVVATLAVIMVHVATPPVFTGFNAHDTTHTVWWIGNVYDSVCRFCVPVFIMLTGALLLPQKIGLGNFLKKRVSRILLPFVFWSLVYIVFNLALQIRDKAMPFTFESLTQWLYLQVTAGAAPHLWYVYMILGLYMFIPIIQPWVTSASNKALLFFLSIWFLVILYHQQTAFVIDSPLDLRYFSGYIGYLVLGYFIAERLEISSASLSGAVVMFIAGAGFTIVGTYLSTVAQGVFSHAYYEYLTFNVFMLATGIFIIFKAMPAFKDSNVAYTVRNFISRYGYGIYLSHLLVLSILTHFGINYSLITTVIGIPLAALICLIVSAALVYIINKLPYGKYISG